MKREYYKQHSDVLNEDMSMIVYGEGGYPVIAFQCQDSKSNNFEDFGMIDVLAPFINDGRIQIFSVDNLDEESWSDEGGDKGARAWRQEEYFKFVTDELVPRVHAWNNSDLRPLAVGCSMGATHAAIAALRRPDLFQGCIALSGVYSTRYFFGDWMDENLYNNDIPAFLTNMPADHPYV
ncbi:MAG: alpha/beta hydrolase-fold protein, partial [Atopobiaceae bacterium]|nr:alpha/beta hydrolase-fold protein [Atopobiaceae bacterium]